MPPEPLKNESEVPFLVGAALSLLGAWVVYRYVPETVEQRPGAGPSWWPLSRKGRD